MNYSPGLWNLCKRRLGRRGGCYLLMDHLLLLIAIGFVHVASLTIDAPGWSSHLIIQASLVP